MSKSSQQIFTAMSGLKKDEVLRLTPDPDRSMRGPKASVGRVASSNKLKIESWTDADQQNLFVRKV